MEFAPNLLLLETILIDAIENAPQPEPVPKIEARRRSHSRPALEAIKTRIDELLPVMPTKTARGKALAYPKTDENRLTRFVNDLQAGIVRLLLPDSP